MCLGLQYREKRVAMCTHRAGLRNFTMISSMLRSHAHTLDQPSINNVLCREIAVLPLSHSHSSYKCRVERLDPSLQDFFRVNQNHEAFIQSPPCSF